jgi:signal transduction histidine kinase
LSLIAGFAVVVLVYALFRWGTTWEAAVGSAVVLVEWLVSVTTTDFTGGTDAVFGLAVLLLAGAVGMAVRYQRIVRAQQLDRVRFHERDTLARELHDTVAHHVSAMAVQAQAGQFLAQTGDRDGAAEALAVIEQEASRALAEMRSIDGSTQTPPSPAKLTERHRCRSLSERTHGGQIQPILRAVAAAS